MKIERYICNMCQMELAKDVNGDYEGRGVQDDYRELVNKHSHVDRHLCKSCIDGLSKLFDTTFEATF